MKERNWEKNRENLLFIVRMPEGKRRGRKRKERKKREMASRKKRKKRRGRC